MEQPRPSWALPLCCVCSRECIAHGGTLCRLCFDERARVVYWDRGAACNAKGPTKARCLLDEGHAGRHEGNGFDDHGPVYRNWR